MPHISVIIPSYNAASTLSRALNSVFAQTVDDLEVIIVDDASTDDTKAVMSEYEDSRIQFVSHEENRGGSAARNTGIDIAEGELIAFLDADDEWLPRKLELQVEALETRPDEYVAVHCNRTFDWPWTNKLGYRLARIVGARSADPPKEGGSNLVKEVLLGNLSTGASTLLVEAETVAEIGGFDTSFVRHQDWEFLIRILQQGKLAHLDQELVIKHGTGSPNADVYNEAKEILLKTFDDEVERWEAKGYPITHKQQLYLAKMYFEEGKFRCGKQHLPRSGLSAPELLSLAWSIAIAASRHLP